MALQRPWLLMIAAPKEVRAVLDGMGISTPVPEPWALLPLTPGADLVRCGVGKSAAAGAVARWFDPDHHAGVLSVGIAGALPGSWLELGAAVLAEPSVFADEGVLTPKGFLSLERMGFGADAPPTHPDPGVRQAWTGLVDAVAPVATVSVCSGTDALAHEVAARTGAKAEAMEGAACGMAARRIDPQARFAELRVISNTTGNRDRQVWDLGLALARLSEVIGPALRAIEDR